MSLQTVFFWITYVTENSAIHYNVICVKTSTTHVDVEETFFNL